MYPLNLTACTAIDVIQRSMSCHPSLLAEALESEAASDRAYAEGKSGLVKRAVLHRAEACDRAAAVIGNDDASALLKDMAAGIVAFSLACRLQLVPNDIGLRNACVQRAWPDRAA